jgi:hypothetical protein
VRSLAVSSLFALLAGAAPVALALAPKAAGPVAVVVAPWATAGEAARIVAAANGTIVGTARGGDVAIAQFDTTDFVTQLYQSGALLVLDARAVAACLTIERDHTSPAARTSS